MAAGLLFDACISASKRQTAKGGEDGEEFHFEVAEGRGEGVKGGRYICVCVCVWEGGVSFQQLDSAITTFQLISP